MSRKGQTNKQTDKPRAFHSREPTELNDRSPTVRAVIYLSSYEDGMDLGYNHGRIICKHALVLLSETDFNTATALERVLAWLMSRCHMHVNL